MPRIIQTREQEAYAELNRDNSWPILAHFEIQFKDIISQNLFDHKDKNHYMYIMINTTSLFPFSFVPHVHYVNIL